ncbi:MAG: polysaccharide biosynthesis/export family protein [Bacteroidales bacterium]|nr:polysaccharide biosynthesis/export family protein [Bacteroidales bacterium]
MKTLRFILISAMCAAMVSCGSHKKKSFVYLQDMTPGLGYPSEIAAQTTVRPGDKLSITVTCKNPELAAPFNASTVTMGSDGSVRSVDLDNTYRVDPNGYIDFPVLGEIRVEDKTLAQVRELIKEKIEEGNYIKNPIVKCELLNLRYTVLGAVGSNGNFSTDEGRITLLEAIANAGDITANGRIDNVAVIREEDGGRTLYTHDLKSHELFDSPCFYLQQNDIVYVEPKRNKDTRSEDLSWKVITVALSAISTVTAVLWYTTK